MVNESIELHAIIHGYVQGVGFRATARHYGEQLKLDGTARNCPNGTVEIYAQGKRVDLDRLLELLKERFQITSIIAEYTPLSKKFSGFSISH